MTVHVHGNVQYSFPFFCFKFTISLHLPSKFRSDIEIIRFSQQRHFSRQFKFRFEVLAVILATVGIVESHNSRRFFIAIRTRGEEGREGCD